MIPSVVVSLILQYSVVSSAYIIILKKLLTDGRSLIYIYNLYIYLYINITFKIHFTF